MSYIESGWWQPHMDGPEAATQLYGLTGFGEVFPTRIKRIDPTSKEATEVDGGFTFPRENQCPQVMYDRQLADFAACVREDRTPTPGASEGLVNMQIVDAAYRSAKSGRVEEVI